MNIDLKLPIVHRPSEDNFLSHEGVKVYSSLTDRPAAAAFGVGKCIVSTSAYTIESVSDGTEYYSQGHSASITDRPSAATFGNGVWNTDGINYHCDGASWYVKSYALAPLLIESRNRAIGKNPFDVVSTATQPLVSAVTIGAAAFAAPVSYNYLDSGVENRLPIIGIPLGEKTYSVKNNSSYVSVKQPATASGSDYAGLAFSDNIRGGWFMECLVNCDALQFNVRGVGNSSNYFPIWVNGVPVAPAVPAATANPTDNLQVSFAARGTYHVVIGSEQQLGLKGITVSEDDTVYPIADQRIPIVMYGDSYTMGSTSPQTIGGLSLPSAISWIGGVNCIPSGVAGTGYINAAGIDMAMTKTGRLQYLAYLVNTSNSPLVIIPAGYNDVTQSYTAAAIQAAAATIIDYLLTNTSANIILFGAQPGKRNNSAAQIAVDAGISAAVTAVNTNRVAFVPIAGAAAPWITGTRDTAHTAGLIAGNSRYYTGSDSTHLSPFVTSAPNIPANTTTTSGVEYLARKIVDSIIATAQSKGW